MSVVPPPPSRQRWLIPVVLVVLSVTVGGGLLARELYRRPDAPASAATVVASPSASEPGSRDEPGSGQVQVLADAVNHPQGELVRTLLQAYFDALNTKDYTKWKSTVSDQRRARTPERSFQRDFQSTADGNILLYRIEPGGQGDLQALVGFTSTQSTDQAPQDFPQKCIRWRLVLPLVLQHNSYRIDVPENVTPEREAC